MSDKRAGIIGVTCVVVLALMPLFTSKAPKGDISKGGVIRDETLIQVTSSGKSDSGFVYCKFFIKDINKEFIGGCNDTNNKLLKVGGNYIATRFKIENSNITINEARLINSDAKLKVISIQVIGRAVIAELSNGARVGGDHLNVGDEVFQ